MYIRWEIQIALSFSFAVVHSTFLLYSMQFDQSENFLPDGMQVNQRARSGNFKILNILKTDEKIELRRLWTSTFWDIFYNFVKHKPDTWRLLM